jgi:hypothetical protein
MMRRWRLVAGCFVSVANRRGIGQGRHGYRARHDSAGGKLRHERQQGE